MSRPSVSVLLPVRDAASFLEEALGSLALQTYEDFEVLVQDDGSTDLSYAEATGFADEDPRFRVETDEPRGIVAALNAAAARARGDLLVRMDADDVCLPTRLERLVAAAAAHQDVGFFASRIRYVPRESLGEGLKHYEAWVNGVLTHEEVLRNRFVECPLPHPAWAVRRAVFDDLGGYHEGDFPEDYDFFLRAAAAGVRFHKLPEVLLQWRNDPGRMSRTDERFGLDRFFALKLRHLLPLLGRIGRPVAIAGAGPDGKRWAKALLAADVPVRFFLEVHPRRIGQTIHGAEVLAYDDIDRLRPCFVLGAVGQKGGRDEVRRLLDQAGFTEGDDYLCVQ